MCHYVDRCICTWDTSLVTVFPIIRETQAFGYKSLVQILKNQWGMSIIFLATCLLKFPLTNTLHEFLIISSAISPTHIPTGSTAWAYIYNLNQIKRSPFLFDTRISQIGISSRSPQDCRYTDRNHQSHRSNFFRRPGYRAFLEEIIYMNYNMLKRTVENSS